MKDINERDMIVLIERQDNKSLPTGRYVYVPKKDFKYPDHFNKGVLQRIYYMIPEQFQIAFGSLFIKETKEEV